AAFSGKLANKNHQQKFVPPVFDSLTENSFLNVGMRELNRINEAIKQLEKSPNWLAVNKLLTDKKSQAAKEIAALKLELKQKKIHRTKQRQIAEKGVIGVELQVLTSQLDKESSLDRKALKKLKKEWKAAILECEADLAATSQEIQHLKVQRKKKSNGLQQQLFEAYQFLNHRGKAKSLTALFRDRKRVSGAGECAAPKLLQYAFLHQLKPIALAEFWWGKSPKSEIRKHGHFYPPCEEKCRPILGYMLEGL
ncbi:MAG: RNA pseudouridine synthase, partial [Saprospiraceae bacterium]